MRHMKLKFRVIDKDDNDITHKHEWYIDANGDLYIMTDDVNSPLADASDFCFGCRLQFYYE